MPGEWHDIPTRLHPVRCGVCMESWFVRTQGIGGNQDRDYWPRFYCYCGVAFGYTTLYDLDGTPGSQVDFAGNPLKG